VSASKLQKLQIWKLTGLIEKGQISYGIGSMGMPGATAYGGLIDVLRPLVGDHFRNLLIPPLLHSLPPVHRWLCVLNSDTQPR
jgi:hypothetical protein